MRFLALCLLCCSALFAHAGNGDFIKATINGKPYALTGDSVAVLHAEGSKEYDQSITVSASYSFPAKQPVSLGFYLAFGAQIKPGIYRLPLFMDMLDAKPPYAYVQIDDGTPTDPFHWSVEDPGEGELVVTAVNGNVVEGTFRGKLRSSGRSETMEVKNGTFRFTME